MTLIKCSLCGELTSNSYGICDTCRAARVARDRAEQGLPPKITDDPAQAAWLARILLPSQRIAS